MDGRNLDWSRLLGFDQGQGAAVDLRGLSPVERLQACAELAAKVGSKEGNKNARSGR